LSDDTAPPQRGLIALSTLLENRRIRMLRWDKFDEVVHTWKPKLREISQTRTVVKDPRFCQTLAVWAAADVPIEHVVLCIRSLDAAAHSLVTTQNFSKRARFSAKNHIAYRLGLCLGALHGYRIRYAVVQFPDLLESPDHLFARMEFPRLVSREDFMHAFRRVAQPSLVHDWR
jgi:hypothetical protein